MRKVAVAVIAIIVFAAPARSQDRTEKFLHTVQHPILWSGTAFDWGTSLEGFTFGRVEANPLLNNDVVRKINNLAGRHHVADTAMVFGSSAVTEWLMHRYVKPSNPKIASFVEMLVGSVHFYAGWRNLK